MKHHHGNFVITFSITRSLQVTDVVAFDPNAFSSESSNQIRMDPYTIRIDSKRYSSTKSSYYELLLLLMTIDSTDNILTMS